MRIGELARRAGTTQRTIGYYEELGLIGHAGRTHGGFRLYGQAELATIRLIRDLQLLDFPLSRIKELLGRRRSARTGAEAAPGLVAILRKELEETKHRISRYQAMQAAIEETIGLMQECCRCCPLEPRREVCSQCEQVRARGEVPLPMQALIAAS
jgi:DNA-binding transcriptional MerR regulator